MTAGKLHVRRVDYSHSPHRDALIALLDSYARDPMGGGTVLPAEVRERLCDDLAQHPLAASFIAWLGAEPVDLAGCSHPRGS